MKRLGILTAALAAGLLLTGCNEVKNELKDRTNELVREQRAKAISGTADAAREKLDESRESIGDALSSDKEEKEDADAKALKGEYVLARRRSARRLLVVVLLRQVPEVETQLPLQRLDLLLAKRVVWQRFGRH